MNDVDRLRYALAVIGTECERLFQVTCAYGNYSPYAKYGADRWCDQCIARTALNGEDLPAPGASGLEEDPPPFEPWPEKKLTKENPS